MILLRLFCCCIACTIALLGTLSPAVAADNVVNAAFKAPSIDLLPVLKLVKSTTPRAVIELPSGADGSKRLMSLQARNQDSSEYNWVVFSLKNPELRQQDIVLTIPYLGFVGSGALWPATEGSRIVGLQVSEAIPAARLEVGGVDAIALTVAPGASLTYAIELPAETIEEVRLWRRTAFDDKARQHAFFRGIVLGISILLAIGISCLFIVKPRIVFPAAALFAWSSIGFILLNVYSLPGASEGLAGIVGRPGMRAIVEALMLTGVSATFLTYLELRHRSVILYGLLLCFVLSGLGLLFFSLYQPLKAQGLARFGFAAATAIGIALTLYYWQRGVARGQTGLLPAILLAVWTATASIACLGLAQSSFLLPVTTVGLVLVLVTLALALVPVAFGNSVGSAYFMQDSGRRALALAGSELSVWDWQIEENKLYVGPELERALGMSIGSIDEGGVEAWAGRIHPADRSAYFSAVEAAERRGRGAFGQEFRLRRSDGTYRWYELRARAILGAAGASRLIGTLSDITAQKRAEESILADAVHDRVTGLPNKALFLDRLETVMKRHVDVPIGGLYVVVVDLDRFKSVNDGLGHEIGDSLLNVTGRRIGQLLHPKDALARMPGDQFALLIDCRDNKRDVGQLCEQLRDTLAQPVNLRPREVYITASIGVAACTDPRQIPAECLKDAEVALHEAKRVGKQMIQFFSQEMRSDTAQRTVLKTELEGAIECGELSVYYQPIQRVADGQLAGFEALVRWEHPTDGLREPDSFIPLAEQTGLIKPIGRFVLMEAMRQLGIWQRAFRPSDPLFVAVNVSSEQLLDFGLVNDVKAVLTREGIQPGSLKLELTETLVMQNLELSVKILQHIKELGVGLACDDFGTGYSALSNLRRLPFDTLKLDREFLDHSANEEKSDVILESIVLMAHDLELDIVVEGVENSDQLEQLKTLECDYAQGFFIGGPVSAPHVIEALGSAPYSRQANGQQNMATWELLHTLAKGETGATPIQPASTVQSGSNSGQMKLGLEAANMDAQASADQAAPSSDETDELSVWPEDDGIVGLPVDGGQDESLFAELDLGHEGSQTDALNDATESVAEDAKDVVLDTEQSHDEQSQMEELPQGTAEPSPDVKVSGHQDEIDPAADSDPEPAAVETADQPNESKVEDAIPAATDPEPAAVGSKVEDVAPELSKISNEPGADSKQPGTKAKRATAKPRTTKPVRAKKSPTKKATKSPLGKKLHRAAKSRARKRKP